MDGPVGKPFVIWACELCVGGACSDHQCKRGAQCQAWLCTPQAHTGLIWNERINDPDKWDTE